MLLAQKVMSSSTMKEELLLEGQELDVIDETVQPDQYLWHNLQYSFAEIRMISRIFKAFTIATAVMSLIISLTFSGLQDELGINIDCSNVQSDASFALDKQSRLDI